VTPEPGGGRPAAGAPSRTARDALPVTFRPVVTRVLMLTLAAASLVVFGALAALMPADGAWPWHTGERVTVLITGVLISAGLVALSRPRAEADRDGLTVVNVARRRRLDWPEILGVHLRPGDAWVRLDLADGTSLAVMGIQPGIARQQALRDGRLLRDLVRELGEVPGERGAGPR
jgi:hypothetical protein